MRREDTRDQQLVRRRLACGVVVALGSSFAVMASSAGNDSALGAPAMWPWLLTGLQVLALWAAGRQHWWAWLFGGAVQIPWMAYAPVTAQIGFIPGRAMSASVQISSFLRNSTATTRLEAMA